MKKKEISYDLTWPWPDVWHRGPQSLGSKGTSANKKVQWELKKIWIKKKKKLVPSSEVDFFARRQRFCYAGEWLMSTPNTDKGTYSQCIQPSIPFSASKITSLALSHSDGCKRTQTQQIRHRRSSSSSNSLLPRLPATFRDTPRSPRQHPPRSVPQGKGTPGGAARGSERVMRKSCPQSVHTRSLLIPRDPGTADPEADWSLQRNNSNNCNNTWSVYLPHKTKQVENEHNSSYCRSSEAVLSLCRWRAGWSHLKGRGSCGCCHTLRRADRPGAACCAPGSAGCSDCCTGWRWGPRWWCSRRCAAGRRGSSWASTGCSAAGCCCRWRSGGAGCAAGRRTTPLCFCTWSSYRPGCLSDCGWRPETVTTQTHFITYSILFCAFTVLFLFLRAPPSFFFFSLYLVPIQRDHHRQAALPVVSPALQQPLLGFHLFPFPLHTPLALLQSVQILPIFQQLGFQHFSLAAQTLSLQEALLLSLLQVALLFILATSTHTVSMLESETIYYLVSRLDCIFIHPCSFCLM